VPAGKIGERGRNLKPATGAFQLQGWIFTSRVRGFDRLFNSLASRYRMRKANGADLDALADSLGSVSG
jgi:hypothetical protein